MKYVNNYANLTAYTADTNRPTTLSTVSNLEDGNEVRILGKNVLVGKPGAGVGDILVFDKNTSSLKYIKYGTYTSSTLSSNLIPGGVVYERIGNKVLIVSKDNSASARWAQGYKVKLTFSDISAGGSFTVTVNSTTSPLITYPAGSTLSSVVSLINTAINSGADNTALKNWTVAAGASWVTIERNWYTPVLTTVSVTNITGIVVSEILTPVDYQTTLVGSGILPDGFIERNSGLGTSYGGANLERFLEHYTVSGTTKTITDLFGDNTIINKVSYLDVGNTAIRALYGEGDSGYLAYIVDRMVKFPYSKGAIRKLSGKTNTEVLSGKTFTDADGTQKPAYPAAWNASQYSFTVPGYTTGLEIGKWWLPSPQEMLLLVRKCTNADTDRINLSLAAIGGNVIDVNGASRWTSGEFSSNNSWLYLSYGYLYNFTKLNSLGVRGVTAL